MKTTLTHEEYLMIAGAMISCCQLRKVLDYYQTLIGKTIEDQFEDGIYWIASDAIWTDQSPMVFLNKLGITVEELV